MGTDITTHTDVEISTQFEIKVTPAYNSKLNSPGSQVTDSAMIEPTTVLSTISDLPTSTGYQKTEPLITESLTEISTINIELLNKVTTEADIFVTTTTPVGETTKTEGTAENTEFTGSVSEIISVATTVIPEGSTEQEIITAKTYFKTSDIKTTTESIMASPVFTEKSTNTPTSNTTEFTAIFYVPSRRIWT